MTLSKPARKLAPLLIVAAAIIGFLVLRATGPSAPPPATSERVWQVRGMTVEPAVHQPTLELYGRVVSPTTALLRAATEGYIAEVPARAGQVLAEGALLVQIDPAEALLTLAQREADLREAEALLESERLRAQTDQRTLGRERELQQLAQRGLERARDLRTRNLGSEVSVDDAQRVVEQARLTVDAREQAVADAPARLEQADARRQRVQAAAERAQLDLARTEVRTLALSRVVEVHVSPGERVREGDPLVRLYTPDDVEIHASLPEVAVPRVIRLLAEGYPLPASATVDGLPVEAELRRLAGETRSGETGINAIFTVTAEQSALPLNRFVNLHLSLAEEAASVAVPFEALYGRDRVYRVVDNRLQGLRVERLGEIIDPENRTLALISHPELGMGDVLVVTRLPNAVDGLRVEVTMDTGPATL